MADVTVEPWTRAPWFGHVIVRGSRDVAAFERRLVDLDGVRVDGRRVRVKRRGDRVKVWRTSGGRYDPAGPVLEGRVRVDPRMIEVDARVRPAALQFLAMAYVVGLVVWLLATAAIERRPAALVGLAVPAVLVVVFGLGMRRDRREGLAAAETVLCRALAGHVVERRPWRPPPGKGTSTSG